MALRVQQLPRAGAAANLSFEERFLQSRPESTNCFLFFYENQESIILGRTLDEKLEVFGNKPHPPVYRRLSGGGSVVHFRGNLNYTFAAPLEAYPALFPVHDSYRILLSAICASMPKKFTFMQKGLSDIAIYQQGLWRKISGNSQVRRRGWILQHGTFLYSTAQMKKISYWLRPPPKEPDYRGKRNHRDFMIQTVQGLQKPIVKGAIWRGLKSVVEELQKDKK